MYKLWVGVLVFLFSFGLLAGEIVTFNQSLKSASIKPVVNRNNSFEFKMELPRVIIDDITINGKLMSKITVPGGNPIIAKGYPELYKVTAFVAVPDCSRVIVEDIKTDYIIKKVNTVIPSKGNVLRNVDINKVPYTFGEIYNKNIWFPEKIVKVSKPFVLRNIMGVQLEIIPFQYNPVKNEIKIIRSLTLNLKPIDIKKSTITLNNSWDFDRLYSDIFINYSSSVKAMPQAPEVKRNLLIITADEFYNQALELKKWKIQAGFKTDVVKVSEIGKSSDNIKAYIQNRYNNNNLSFVILIGDSDQIATLRGKYEGAPSDMCYVKLAGNDNIPDAFISRISVETPEEAEYIIMKSIYYEQYPMTGNDGNWYKQALGIASAQGNPKDYERVNELNDALKEGLNFTKIFTCYDTTYWGGANKNVIFEAFNSGISIINYCGHGSDYSWVTGSFSTNDAYKLNNGLKLPVVWDVACVNGAYVGKTCFAESLLRTGNKNNPAGVIGIAASSTNMAWVPPCVWQKHIIEEETVKQKHLIASVINLYGVLKCMEVYGTDDKTYGNQLNEQVHYFGDGTVALRTEIPQEIYFSKNKMGNKLQITVINKETREPIKDCIISIYDYNYNNMKAIATNANGEAEIDIENQTLMTISGANIVPAVDEEI